jgi:tyrosinase
LTGALALAAVPWGSVPGFAQTGPLVRRCVTASDFPSATLESFKRAIRAMLALPPSDPRNWYRQALVHLFDCPHANWWFLPWHRGYLYHFEAICRELSGDPAFAVPFWDWTAAPQVPDALFDDVLTPRHPLYEESLETFRPKFEPAIAQFWNELTPDQRQQLALRGCVSPADVWDLLESYFCLREEARRQTRESPELPDWARTEVGPERVEAALAPKRFEDFGSAPADHHHQRTLLATLESAPHNNIHNAVGGGPGFMSELLAPVDPIFWLHHANVDRLWDLWTRRERQAGRTGLPANADRWKREPFLFFGGGEALAGRYLEVDALGYSYGPGYGEDILRASHPAGTPGPTQQQGAATFEGEKVNAALRTDAEASASVRVPNALLAEARKPKKKGGAHSAPSSAAEPPELVAQVSLSPPRNPRAVRVLFFMNCSYLSPATPISDPHYVGSVTFFGLHGGAHHAAEEVAATLPLNATLQRLAEVGEPVVSQVKLQGIAARDGEATRGPDGALVQVSVKTL